MMQTSLTRTFRSGRSWFRLTVIAAAVVATTGCATVIKRSALETAVVPEQRVAIALQSDQEGTFASTLRAAFIDRGYQTVFLADAAAVPPAARAGRRFSTLSSIASSIGESGEVQMPNQDFQSFLQQTDVDSSIAYLRSYRSLLDYIRDDRGADVLLVVNNERSLRVWAYAYDLENETVLFSYYLSTSPLGFETAVPRASTEENDGWIVEVPIQPTNNADVRALDVAEDIVQQVTEQ